MHTRRYRAVLFDLDGTLRANQPEGFEAFVEYAGRVGIALTEEQIKICEREAHRYWASDRVDADMARYDQRGFWVNYNQILLNAMNVARDCADCAHRIQDLFDGYDPQDVVFADTRPVLQALHDAGYTLGLVSNREEPLEPFAEQYGIRQFFAFMLSAGQAGCYKPDPRIFYRALELAGNVPPSKAVYIGDNFFADVIGALNVGMDAILIDPRNVFERYYTTRVRRLRDVLSLIETRQAESNAR
ncbi:HAD family hydrolase [Candidatus Roseilinea sp. NK_OTU-006]|nr:HAD family hydrolase [Candidatus Roseilinea sp. NK_OTU-006]